MDFVLTMGTAGLATWYLVALFKMAVPTSPSYGVVAVALLSGITLCFVVTMATAEKLTRKEYAMAIIGGIFAAAAAAGIRKTDNSADAEREKVQP